MNSPLITILIRTSNRPQHFKRLLRSINRQSYKNVQIIVSYDTFIKPYYIPNSISCVNVSYLEIVNRDKYPAWYNLYCNELMKHVHSNSYFVFVDDDDFLVNRSLEAIVEHLNEDKALILQMSRNRRKKPANEKEGIQPGRIGLPCIILHAKHKDLHTFDGSMDADYKWIKAVTDKIGYDFLETVLVECPQRSYGKV